MHLKAVFSRDFDSDDSQLTAQEDAEPVFEILEIIFVSSLVFGTVFAILLNCGVCWPPSYRLGAHVAFGCMKAHASTGFTFLTLSSASSSCL